MSEKTMVTIDCDLTIPEEAEKVFENQHIRLVAGIKCRGKLIFKDCIIESYSSQNTVTGKQGRRDHRPGSIYLVSGGSVQMERCNIIRPCSKFLLLSSGNVTAEDTKFQLAPMDTADAIISGSGELRFDRCTFTEESSDGKSNSNFAMPMLINDSISDKVYMGECITQNISSKIFANTVCQCSFSGCADIECAQISDSSFEDCKGISVTDGHIERCHVSRVKHVFIVQSNIDNCTFRQMENDAEDEGIIFVEDSKVTHCTFDDMDLRNNSYLIDGVGDSSVEDCQFTNCRTDREDSELCRMERNGVVYIQSETTTSMPMGLLKGALKLAGSAALAAAGAAATIVREAANATGSDVLSDVAGTIQDASFEKIRDMWGMDGTKKIDNMSLEALGTFANGLKERMDDDERDAFNGALYEITASDVSEAEQESQIRELIKQTVREKGKADRAASRAEDASRSAEQFRQRYEKEKAKFDKEYE